MSITVDSILASELSPNITFTPEDKATRLEYWRKFLQFSVSPPISDENVNNEESWPALVNVLIAKLVIYDLTLKAARDAMIGTFGGSVSESEGSGALKSLETGPSKAEWYDTSKSLEYIFKPGPDGKTIFDAFTKDLCMLASRVNIKLSICEFKSDPFVPRVIRTKPKYSPEEYLIRKHNTDQWPT